MGVTRLIPSKGMGAEPGAPTSPLKETPHTPIDYRRCVRTVGSLCGLLHISQTLS